MSKAMEKFLDHLIEDSDEESADVQIIFQPGMGANAGSMRKAKGFDGVYELCTFTAPANVSQAQAQRMDESDLIATSMFFEADSVQRVMMVTDAGGLQAAGSGIVMPGQA